MYSPTHYFYACLDYELISSIFLRGSDPDPLMACRICWQIHFPTNQRPIFHPRTLTFAQLGGKSSR